MPSDYDLADRVSESARGFRVLNALGVLKGDITQTIVLAGSPRSGTTWLAELLSALPGYTLVDEPLHKRWAAARRAGLDDWRTYIAPSAHRPAARNYLRKALTGRVASTRQFSSASQPGKLLELLAGKKNVVKFVRANRLLNWLHDQFPVLGTILMLRHPCAVVSSQLNYEDDSWRRIDPPSQESLQTGFHGWVPDEVCVKFEHVLANIRSTTGCLAAIWCLDTYFALSENDAFPGLITTYERLLTQERGEVRRIFQWLGVPIPTQALEGFDEASYSASSDLVTEDVHRQLSKWRKKLSAEQIDEILEIVEGFGLDFYTDALEPDYSGIQEMITPNIAGQSGKAEAV